MKQNGTDQFKWSCICCEHSLGSPGLGLRGQQVARLQLEKEARVAPVELALQQPGIERGLCVPHAPHVLRVTLLLGLQLGREHLLVEEQLGQTVSRFTSGVGEIMVQ